MWVVLAAASIHRLQVLTPVAGGSEAGLCLAVVAASIAAWRWNWRLQAWQRSALFVGAWLSLPGLLDRSYYPWFSGRLVWPIGWMLVLAPWSLLLSVSRPRATSWKQWTGEIVTAGLTVAALLLWPAWITSNFALALTLAGLLIAQGVPVRPRSVATHVLPLLLLALSDPARLAAAPGERIRDQASRVGRTLSVVQSAEGEDVLLRDRFHSVLLSTANAQAAKRAGLLPFRLHPSAKRILLLGATNPPLASAALEVQPDRLTWIDPEVLLFSLSRWWTSELAARNRHTLIKRVIQPIHKYLRSDEEYYDVAVIAASAPWTAEGSAAVRGELPGLVHDRLYPDGIAIQWIHLHQWTEPRLAELIQRWRDAFGERVELWRADLSPSSPAYAIVARGKTAAPETDLNPNAVLRDSLIGLRTPSFSLRIASSKGLAAVIPNARERIGLENPWIAASLRRLREPVLDARWIIQRFSSEARAIGGPPEGGLLYTEAWVAKEEGRPWMETQAKAVRLLGFNPDELYPEMRAPNSKPSESVAAPDRER